MAKKKLPINGIVSKIESDATDIRAKYPEIAKMTMADIVETEIFAQKLELSIIGCSKMVNYYALQSLKQNKTLEPDNFKKEYIKCLDSESNLPVAKRIVILCIGEDAYKRTVKQMMKEYDNAKKHNS